MTAPRRLEPPVIIRSHRNAVVLKWYPGPGGAYKYHLQSRAIEGLGEGGAVADINWAGSGGDGVGGVYRRRKAWSEGGEGSGGWVTMYEGVDSTAKVSSVSEIQRMEGLWQLTYFIGEPWTVVVFSGQKYCHQSDIF